MALRLIGRVGATALPKQVHFAGIEPYKPERGSNRRCFASTVGTNKADDLAKLHGKRDVAQRKAVAHMARCTFDF